jgi:hypothetical protein
MNTWYNRYAVIIFAALLWFIGYEFIDWKEMKSADWAAWVQALGSISAIIAAFYIGERQSNTALKAVKDAGEIAESKRIQSLIGMAHVADHLATKTQSVFLEGGFTSLAVSLAQIDDSLEVLRIGLDAIPLHEVGSGSAVSALIVLRTSCGHLQRALDRAKTWRQSSQPLEGTYDWYEYDTGVIRLCCTNIKRSSADLNKAFVAA